MSEPNLPNLFSFPDAQKRFAEIARWVDDHQTTSRAKDTDSLHAAVYAHLAYMADITVSLRRIADASAETPTALRSIAVAARRDD